MSRAVRRSPVRDDGWIRFESVETSGPFQADISKQVSSSVPANMFSRRRRCMEQKRPVGLDGVNLDKPLKSRSDDQKFPPLAVSISFGSKLDPVAGRRTQYDNPSPCERLQSPNWDETPLTTPSGKRTSPPLQRNRRNSIVKNRIENNVSGTGTVIPFDICLPNDGHRNRGKLLWIKKEEIREEREQIVLRPGMLLLKRYLSMDEQVKIVRTCRELGVGQGGFYQPGYKDGAKLRLHMMCLGLNWDPETKYAVKHDRNTPRPPVIPDKFGVLVQEAIRDAHALMEKDSGAQSAESMLPGMYPDICIINFYKETGRLGLHQDRDESRESIGKGLPVVSFSIGDSAEFLYGDNRNVEKAVKVILDSGDVLIFGGESRLVFHGVASIIENSAPKLLLAKSRLRPGRLNLTFRKF